MQMHHIRCGSGKPLLMVHGIGGTWKSWTTILDTLALSREVIALDLPGHGATPPLPGEPSFENIVDAVEEFIESEGLTGIDIVGSSMGARIVVELVRRGGIVGSAVALDPGGFWQGWERSYFLNTIGISIRLMHVIRPLLPLLLGNPITRSLMLVQFSAHPWRLRSSIVLEELRGYLDTPTFLPLLKNLAKGPAQNGMEKGASDAPLTIVWGKNDRVCLTRQAARAIARFPDAKFEWFDDCGHFPQWDHPEQTVQLILANTGNS